MCGEARKCESMCSQVMEHCSSDGNAIKSRSSPTKFIKNDKRTRCGISNDLAAFIQFNFESGLKILLEKKLMESLIPFTEVLSHASSLASWRSNAFNLYRSIDMSTYDRAGAASSSLSH